VKLHYLHERQLMGSAGAVKPLQSFFTETFVVVGCDDLTDANLASLVAFHKKRGALATIGLVYADEVDQYGVVITDDRGRILEFQEKPPKGTERSNQHRHLRVRTGDLRLHSGRHVLRFR
jgi:NDP-sugar pyrophosphorylase family protein